MHPKQCTQISGHNKMKFKKVCFTNMNENQLTDIHISETPGIAWQPQEHHTGA